MSNFENEMIDAIKIIYILNAIKKRRHFVDVAVLKGLYELWKN